MTISHAEVINWWITHKGRLYSRSSKNLICCNDYKIYSYGTHYILGKWWIDEDAVLVNATPYSVSTTRHGTLLKRALVRKGVSFFEVPIPDPQTSSDHNANISYLVAMALEEAKLATKARKNKVNHYTRMHKLIAEANAYKTTFKFSDGLPIPDPNSLLEAKEIFR